MALPTRSIFTFLISSTRYRRTTIPGSHHPTRRPHRSGRARRRPPFAPVELRRTPSLVHWVKARRSRLEGLASEPPTPRILSMSGSTATPATTALAEAGARRQSLTTRNSVLEERGGIPHPAPHASIWNLYQGPVVQASSFFYRHPAPDRRIGVICLLLPATAPGSNEARMLILAPCAF